jgi:tetratricopeptide (TPR) repeat protein
MYNMAMAKQKNQGGRPGPSAGAKDQALTVILTGVVCLGAGLGIGYYFGARNATPAPIASAPAPVGQAPSGGVVNPAEFMQAEAGLKAAAARDPKDVNALTRLGNLYYDNGKFREAVDWYGRALELDPDNVSVRTDRGTSYWNLGEADPAIAEFNRSLQSNPTHAQTLYNLGVVYLHGKNNPAQARQAWEKLLATNPGYPDRARLEQQIAQLASSPATPSSTAPQNVEDLLHQLKK